MKKSIYFACISLLVGSLAVAQTTQRPAMPKSATPSATSADMTSTDAFRASKLIGTNVKNNDGDTIGEVLEVMADLAREGRTMLVATHEMGFAAEAAGRVLFLDEGRIAEEGPPDQIFETPRNPRTRQFLERILRRT